MEKDTIQYIVDAVEQANPQRNSANLNRRLHKMLEELGELAEAYLNATSKNNLKGKTWADVKEEAVDALIVAIDIVLTDIFDGDEYGIGKPKKMILWIAENVSHDYPNYDFIIQDILNDLALYWGKYDTEVRAAHHRGVRMVSGMFTLVQNVYDTVDEGDNEIIAEVDRKLAKWATSRNKVAEIDPEG